MKALGLVMTSMMNLDLQPDCIMLTRYLDPVLVTGKRTRTMTVRSITGENYNFNR